MHENIEAPDVTPTERQLALVATGRGHGDILRLMSPSDLGEHLKPFVFLDLFAGDMRLMQEAMPIHPHSGIATVTVFTDGDVCFDDPQAGSGRLDYGGVEWMRAGGGVWHGKELSAGESATIQGFQLWIALPPELENGPVESQYIEAREVPAAGPARVILGKYEGATSPVRAPDGIVYLLVRLGAGERWTFTPPAGHTVGWLAVAKGELRLGQVVQPGQIAVFEEGREPIALEAGLDGSSLVIGTAEPHDHPLHLGYYSVHTSAAALEAGERRIAEIGERLSETGDRRTTTGTIPVYR
ncbi:Redox-sensitive bicupin YhaK, pirin superfamily [Sphingobium sp. AP50]|uniref:pirin family protein n=1 Tax=Sphingobium sp. AP50 TaxID=1884369 RepID=UPI0008C80D1B|nr:pirin family protein [Sphingobium sp. AP50]SEJ81439.1 Redox-sensitive bicupin YhaK, pirin superfamily [Sphingobium sp. AP50]